MLDLSTAVRNAILRHDQDELHEEVSSTSRAQSEGVDPGEDELAGASETARESILPMTYANIR